ncbi:sodium/potassium-transporting ATPase subunit gamma [Clupea harengus]|uniref:FXYD domain-containing ion transport regulator n=1 Tax=Clupea harengus TaxID=7950 RepID=A0A8M1KK02_CLUHA|nr:sodium/potassium-transporting ATPase subunit gamma [Clupea harengus]
MIGEVRFSLVVSLDGADCHPFPYSTHPQKLLTLGLEYHWISLVVSVQKSQGVQEHHSVLTMGDVEDTDADFVYDYGLIRRGGLIFAGVISVLAVAIIFSKKLSCGMKAKLSAKDEVV